MEAKVSKGTVGWGSSSEINRDAFGAFPFMYKYRALKCTQVCVGHSMGV